MHSLGYNFKFDKNSSKFESILTDSDGTEVGIFRYSDVTTETRINDRIFKSIYFHANLTA